MWGKTFRLHVGMASTQGDMAILHTLLRQQDPRASPSSYILLIQMQSLFVQPHMPPTWKPWQPKVVSAINEYILNLDRRHPKLRWIAISHVSRAIILHYKVFNHYLHVQTLNQEQVVFCSISVILLNHITLLLSLTFFLPSGLYSWLQLNIYLCQTRKLPLYIQIIYYNICEEINHIIHYLT